MYNTNLMDAASVIKKLKRDNNYFDYLIEKGLLAPASDDLFLKADVQALLPEHRSIQQRQPIYSLQFNQDYFNEISTTSRAYLITYIKFHATFTTGEDILSLRIPKENYELYKTIVEELEIKDPMYKVIKNGQRDYILLRLHDSFFIRNLRSKSLYNLKEEYHPHVLRCLIENNFNITKSNTINTITRNREFVKAVAHFTYSSPIEDVTIYNTSGTKSRPKSSTNIRYKLTQPLVDYLYPEGDDPSNPQAVDYIHNPKFGEALYFGVPEEVI